MDSDRANSIELLKINAPDHEVIRFKHGAMATVFDIIISGKDTVYSEQAAQAAFNELDRLELELSRFIENSDISRINNLKKNETTIVGPDAFFCLKTCADLYLQTQGFFDITAGDIYDVYKYQEKTNNIHHHNQIRSKSIRPFPWLKLDKSTFMVQKLNEDVNIDLGGFGKGYAIDIMAEILNEWDIKSFLINGGMSTVYANTSDHFEWPVSISHPVKKSNIIKINLKGKAIAGSGLVKGTHIINPKTYKPVSDMSAAWAISGSAALSDALSTSFMIMPISQINVYCKNNKSTGAVVITASKKKKIEIIGTWH